MGWEWKFWRAKPGKKKPEEMDFEYGNRKKKPAQKGRKYRKWFRKIMLIAIVAGVGVGIFNSPFIKSLVREVWEKINELRQPTPEVSEAVETTSYSKLAARAKQAFIIIGLVALILISVQSSYNKPESQNLVEVSKEINTDEVRSDNPVQSKSELFKLALGRWIQCAMWIGNILASYSVFWCSCYTHLKKIVPYVTWCQRKYMTFARSGCDELCSHLIDCILSGKQIQILYPYFTIWAATYYNPMLGVFAFIP